MQWLAAICVRRPVFTWVLILGLVVVGYTSLRSLGVDRFPKIDFPVVVVTTELPGASPEQVESEVSDKLEAAINAISGLSELRSVSYEGLSVVTAQFELEKDVAVAAQEVRDRVNRTLTELPREAEQPQVMQLDPDAAPVMLVAVEGPGNPREVTDIADRVVRRRLESVNGVGQATVLGGRERQILVEVDPTKMAAFGLVAADVERALATQNVEIPGGTLVEGPRSRLVRVEGRVDSPEAFARIAVAQRAGAIVRIGDVAKVEDAAETPSSVATLDGAPVVLVSVAKQSGTNTVAVVDELRDRVDALQGELPSGYSVRVVRDESEFIRNAVAAVEEHLVLGSICVAVVVLVFLWNVRATIITAIAIPSSIIATFAFIAAMGLTLNTLTLLALTLAVGIVIDDAIVVLENIVRFLRDRDLPPREAAIEATREIGLAVLATTLSLIAVFLPIAFMGGIVGRFMRSFGLTMSFAVAVSLLVAFTLTPMLSARWLDPARARRQRDDTETVIEASPDRTIEAPFEGRDVERTTYREWQEERRTLAGRSVIPAGRGLYARMERAYLRVLAFCMRRRWVVGLAMLAALIAVVPLAVMVPKNFLPVDDESRFEIYVRAPEGTSLDATRVLADRIARGAREIPGVAYSVVTAGSPPGDPSGRGANEASIFVGLTDPRARALDQQEIMSRVRAEVVPAFEHDGTRALVTPVNVFGAGGTQSATIQYVLRGPDLEQLARYSEDLLARAKEIPGVIEADTTLIQGRPALAVRVDRDRAADLGVSIADAANAVRVMVGGARVATFTERGEEYEVRLRAGREDRQDPDALAQLYVPTAEGGRVRLGEIAEIAESTGPASIERLSRQRQVTIYANVTAGTSEAAVIAALDRAREAMELPREYQAELVGRSRELGRAGQSFATAFLLSLAFMYLVLAAQFESWSLPLAILVSLPMSLPFALLSLVVLGQSLNIFSTLGILVLFGVIKKNGILQVDHVRELRRNGLGRADAVMIGNRHRLRPILMTTLSFVAGMIPLVVSSGAGAGTNRAMGSVIIGGQTLALGLTLLATPVVYSTLDDLAHAAWVRRVRSAVRWPGRRLARALDALRARRRA
jgi:hydrophobic/amphiphilic exporter-1 (mainly G- bacteria), HAE1 family